MDRIPKINIAYLTRIPWPITPMFLKYTYEVLDCRSSISSHRLVLPNAISYQLNGRRHKDDPVEACIIVRSTEYEDLVPGKVAIR